MPNTCIVKNIEQHIRKEITGSIVRSIPLGVSAFVRSHSINVDVNAAVKRNVISVVNAAIKAKMK